VTDVVLDGSCNPSDYLHCDIIEGTVSVGSNNQGHVQVDECLPNTERINGAFRMIGAGNATSIGSDKLQSISNAMIMEHTGIEELSFSGLKNVGTGKEVNDASNLVQFYNNLLLRTVNMPVLEYMNGLRISSDLEWNDSLEELNFPSLQRVGGCPFRTPECEDAPVNEQCAGNNCVISVAWLKNLKRVFMENLEVIAGDLLVLYLPNLEEVYMPSMTSMQAYDSQFIGARYSDDGNLSFQKCVVGSCTTEPYQDTFGRVDWCMCNSCTTGVMAEGCCRATDLPLGQRPDCLPE